MNLDLYRLSQAPFGIHVQYRQDASDAGRWITPRPVRYSGAYWYVLGTPDAPTWHLMEDVLSHMQDHDLDDDPLPESPTPAVLDDLSAAARFLLINSAQGMPRAELLPLLPPDLDPAEIGMELSRAGLSVLAPALLAGELAQTRDALVERAQAARAAAGLSDPSKPSPQRLIMRPHLTTVADDAPLLEGRPFSNPVPLAPDAFERVQRLADGTRRVREPERVRWPFTRMAVGDMVTVTGADLIPRAQRAAHAHANHTGKRFLTRRNLATNSLHVYRLK